MQIVIKDYVYSIQFNHPQTPNGSNPNYTWSTAYPNQLEFSNVKSYLDNLDKQYTTKHAYILVCTVEVDEGRHYDYDESIKEAIYYWDGKKEIMTKQKEEIYKK